MCVVTIITTTTTITKRVVINWEVIIIVNHYSRGVPTPSILLARLSPPINRSFLSDKQSYHRYQHYHITKHTNKHNPQAKSIPQPLPKTGKKAKVGKERGNWHPRGGRWVALDGSLSGGLSVALPPRGEGSPRRSSVGSLVCGHVISWGNECGNDGDFDILKRLWDLKTISTIGLVGWLIFFGGELFGDFVFYITKCGNEKGVFFLYRLIKKRKKCRSPVWENVASEQDVTGPRDAETDHHMRPRLRAERKLAVNYCLIRKLL